MDREKYLGLFLTEAREHTEAAGRQVSLLSRGIATPESLNALFRHFHSIKGMAASMGFSEIGSLSHLGEDLLDRARKGEIAIDHGGAEALLETVDRLCAMIEARGRHEGPVTEGAEALAARLREAIDSSGGQAPPDLTGLAVPVASAGRTVRLRIQVDKDSDLPGARLAVARRMLERVATLVAAEPAEDRWLARGFDGRAVFTLRTTSDDEAIVACLRDAIEIHVAEVLPAEPAKPPSAPRAAGPDAAGAQGDRADAARAASAGTIRIPTDALDRFLDTIADLFTRRGMVSESLRGRDIQGASAALSKLSESIDRLRGEVMGLRLLPFEHIVPRLEMTVRDLCRRTGHRAALEVQGAEVALDRSVLEELIDPLGHLLRNAVDHGLEPPDVRRAAGKPETGTIRIDVRQEGERVAIDLADDGRGMDAGAIRTAAVQGGFATEAELAAMSNERVLLLTTIPGFSTAGRVTEISGRGVGLDVVRTRIESLRGRMTIVSEPGRGARISLDLPLTVVLIDAFVVEAGSSVFAVPASGVESVQLVEPSQVRASVNGPFLRESARDGARYTPLLDLEEMLGLTGDSAAPGARPALLCHGEPGPSLLAVSRIRDRRELVVQPLGPPLDRLRRYSGSALLDDGTVALILDVATLARSRG